GGHRAERGDRERDAQAALLHVRAGLPRTARAPRAGARAHGGSADLRAPRRRGTAARPDRRVRRGDDRPVRPQLRCRAELMARIKDTSVDEVKAAADMVAVVSGRTQLRKAGGRYLGRCPFHEERTPSFSVNAVDKLYYCFGCGAKGDLITFVRETEQLDFAGAIEWLADRFNVQIEYEETSPPQDDGRRRAERVTARD